MDIFVQGSGLTQFGIAGTNYCGPGYADGTLLEPNEEATYKVPPTGPVDTLCMDHDQAYDSLSSSADPAVDRLAADLALINGMADLMGSGQLSGRDLAIAAAVIAAFEAKAALYDIPAAVIEAAQNLLESLLDGLADLGEEVLDIIIPPAYGGEIEDLVNSDFNAARNWIPRCEPLVLDLDGDGIETIGANGTVLFDHDGDGTRHSTGWTKADDGIVVLDRNGNGTIDNGGELFGVETVLSNGTKAADGFTALADLDTNQDGVFDASDAQYAHVRIWRDFNQNGLSEAGELKSLSESNVASISLAAEAASTTLSNGNRIIATGTYTRLDGTERAAADLDFATGRFWREFPDTIALADAARSLVDIRGSGAVRDLREAANDWVWERAA